MKLNSWSNCSRKMLHRTQFIAVKCIAVEVTVQNEEAPLRKIKRRLHQRKYRKIENIQRFLAFNAAWKRKNWEQNSNQTHRKKFVVLFFKQKLFNTKYNPCYILDLNIEFAFFRFDFNKNNVIHCFTFVICVVSYSFWLEIVMFGGNSLFNRLEYYYLLIIWFRFLSFFFFFPRIISRGNERKISNFFSMK